MNVAKSVFISLFDLFSVRVFRSDDALDAAHAFLEAVLFQTLVGKSHAHAVLAEPMWLDAKLSEHLKNG